MSENKEAYVVRQRGNIKAWSVEIEQFENQADKAIGKKVDKYRKHIADLKIMRAGLEEKIEKIQVSGEAGWEELKTVADKTFKSLDKSFKTAKAYFN
jgi:hypothetical protein